MNNNEDEGTFWVDEETKELVLQEEDDEQRFYIDEEVELNDNKYLVLIPSEDQDEYEDNEALVLKVMVEDGDEVLSIIENDEEFEKVREAYMDI